MDRAADPSPPPPLPELPPVERAALHAALDALLDARPDGDLRSPGASTPAGGPTVGETLGEALRAACTLRAAIDGSMVSLLPAFESSMCWAGDGHRSPVAWAVANLGLPRAATAGERRVAHACAAMPTVAKAAAAGQLPLAKLRLLADARRAPVEDLFDRDEAILAAEALALGTDALRLRLDRWYYDALAEAHRNEPDRNPGGTDRNHARMRPGFGGRGLLEVDLCPEGRATIEAAIAQEIERWRREGSLESDPRTWAELQADALIALVARGAAHPSTDAARPLVIAVVDLDTLLRRAHPDPTERTARRAEILGVGPISDDTVADLAARAGISLLITGRGGHPLWFGRSRRLATTAQRLAVLATDGDQCYWPGCHAPAHRCQIDHLTGWEQGGTTDIEDLGPICGWHNRLKHRARFQASRAPDGTIEVRRSTGELVTAGIDRGP